MQLDLQALDRIHRLTEHPGWEELRSAANQKTEKHQASITSLLFRSRAPVDPIEIEYYRGFLQGVAYILDGLPNTAKAMLERELAKEDN